MNDMNGGGSGKIRSSELFYLCDFCAAVTLMIYHHERMMSYLAVNK